MTDTERIAPANWTPTSDGNLRQCMVTVWNGWFCRWRDRAATATDAEWAQLLDEADEALTQMGGGDTPAAIMRALLYELDARYREAHCA